MVRRIFDPQAKVLANFDRVRTLLETSTANPILVEVDPSNVCNHTCDFCLSSYVHAGKQMLPEDVLLRLCDDLIRAEVRGINWTGGGEPTVNPFLKKAIIRVGESSEVKMGMFTNGTLLDRFDLFEAVVEHFSWVRFSVDAGSPDTYNRIRRTRSDGDWDRMMANLTRLIEVNSHSPHPIDIGVGFVITPSNICDVLDFARLFQGMNVAYCQFKPEIVNLERDEGIQRKVKFWNMAGGLLREAHHILGDKFQLNEYKLDDLSADPEHFGRCYRKCLGSQLSPCVGADGEVYVCPNLRGRREYSFGSIYERSFVDIWHDTATRRAVMERIEEKEKFAFCTQLCKPHESNKVLWKLHEEYHSAVDKAAWLADKESIGKITQVDHKSSI